MDNATEELRQLASQEEWSDAEYEAALEYMGELTSNPTTKKPDLLDENQAAAVVTLVNGFVLATR